MYKIPYYAKSSIQTEARKEGETLETKVERILSNKEKITDGAPAIYTQRKDGVLAGFNIRTDRWEVATDAMDKVSASRIATRMERLQKIEGGKNAPTGDESGGTATV